MILWQNLLQCKILLSGEKLGLRLFPFQGWFHASASNGNVRKGVGSWQVPHSYTSKSESKTKASVFPKKDKFVSSKTF